MTNETRIVAIVGVLTVIIIGAAGYFAVKSSSDSTGTGADAPIPTAASNLADAGQLVRSDSYSQGDKNAKVTVVEFADYQCPACKAAYPQIKQLEQQYAGKGVSFVFRNFPLQAHLNTLIAHNAAEAAGKQGKYWQMHDALYDHQDDWSADGPTPQDHQQAENLIVGYAKDLGLNSDQVRQAIDKNTYNDIFARDLADGEKLGVNATPTFFVNAQKVDYVQDVPKAIDADLAK